MEPEDDDDSEDQEAAEQWSIAAQAAAEELTRRRRTAEAARQAENVPSDTDNDGDINMAEIDEEGIVPSSSIQ